MNYRCWEDVNATESCADNIEADSPEEAAEAYVEELEDFSDCGATVDVNVSAEIEPERRTYWTVEVAIDWEPLFTAFEAVRREDAP